MRARENFSNQGYRFVILAGELKIFAMFANEKRMFTVTNCNAFVVTNDGSINETLLEENLFEQMFNLSKLNICLNKLCSFCDDLLIDLMIRM